MSRRILLVRVRSSGGHDNKYGIVKSRQIESSVRLKSSLENAGDLILPPPLPPPRPRLFSQEISHREIYRETRHDLIALNNTRRLLPSIVVRITGIN